MKKRFIIIIVVLLGLAFATYILFLVKKASNEVLESFGTINEKFEEISTDNQLRLDSIQKVVMYSEYRDTFERLDVLNQDFNFYIANVKTQLLENVSDPKNYSEMEDPSIGDAYFFDSDENYSEKGQEFVNYIKNYKKEVGVIFRNQPVDIDTQLKELFNNRDDIEDWLEYNFKGFPLVATITRLTSMSSELQTLKMSLLNQLLSN